MPRDLFEFHCTKSGGGCGGYIRIPLQTDDERDVIVICPKCKHEHRRGMKDGEITESRHSTYHDTDRVHKIEPTLAAYSTTPVLEPLVKRGFLGSLWARQAQP